MEKTVDERWAAAVKATPMEIFTDQVADALVELNSTLVEDIYMGFATTTKDPLAIIQESVFQATHLTIDVLGEHSVLLNMGTDEQEPFDFDKLQQKFLENYAATINS